MSDILVVDDEPVVLQVVTTALRRVGYGVLQANSAASALEQAKLHSDKIRLLVVDHSVNGLPGVDLVAAILGVQPNLQVLRFSGRLESDLRASGEMRPESFFLQKPFLPKFLIAKIHEIIGPGIG